MNKHLSSSRFSEAEVLFKQCVDKRKVVNGESPDTLLSMNGLAASYGNEGLDDHK